MFFDLLQMAVHEAVCETKRILQEPDPEPQPMPLFGKWWE